MAHATHLTIGTADRIRLDARQHDLGREDEDGGNEIRQEVQVSITYALDSGDTDLVRLAETKALEVQLAHEAVWNRIGAVSGNAQYRSDCDYSEGGLAHRSFRHDGDEDNKEDEGDAPDDDPFAPDDDPPAAARPRPTGMMGRDSPFPTASVVRLHTGHATTTEGAAPDTPEAAEPDEDPVTGPQKILIRSRAKKAGLTPYALEAMVFKQFRVWKVERLTKAQATSPLDALERDLKANAPEQRDGTEGSARGGDNGHEVATGTA